MNRNFNIMILVLSALMLSVTGFGQDQRPQRMIRIYEDNDFLNIRGQGTDRAYTNGTRLDYLYKPVKKPRFFLSRILPVLSDSSVNIYGFSLMQIVVTPRNIVTSAYLPDDYPYSGALFATHSLRSYDPRKKIGLHSELLVGVMGPASFAKEGQVLMHHIINYVLPEGWQHQYDNFPLINVNLTVEKELWHHKKWLEWVGYGQAMGGTMMNRLSLGMKLRFGKLRPYFDGFLDQYTSVRNDKNKLNNWQCWLIAHPDFSVSLTNAILEGGFGTKSGQKDPGPSVRDKHPLQRPGFTMSYGIGLSKGKFGLSFLQRHTTPMLRGLYNHETFNLSAYFSW